MKIIVRRPEPTLPAVTLTCSARSPDRDAATEIHVSRYRSTSSGLVELEALVASINDFWLVQPALRHLGQCK